MNTELSEVQRHRICENAILAMRDVEGRYLTVCRALHDIKQNRHWEAGWDWWENYCEDLKKTPDQVSRMIRIHAILVLHYKISPYQLAEAGGWSSVAEILPMIDQKTTPKSRVEELLGIVANNTRKNARTGLALAKKGIEECKHKKTRLLLLEICEDCNDRWNVTDDYRIKRK